MANKNNKTAVLMPLILAVVMIAGITIGMNLGKKYPNERIFIYPRNNNKINTLFKHIEERYVDSVNKDKLIEDAIPKILEELDPHTSYIPSSELKEVNEPLKGNFEGVGVQFNITDDTIVIINTISGGPSEKIGVLAGDRIIKIEDSTVAGINISSNDVVKMLKGPKGTKVNVSIHRRDVPELLEFEITRDKIPLYSVDVNYMATDDIGYLKISRFAQTTHKEFKDAIANLNKSGMKKLVLDLRGNGGGLMEAATRIANEFLPGNRLIVYTQGKAFPRQDVHSNNRGVCLDKEVVIMVDQWSASASEILAGALQDNDRGTIIGHRTFGKGLVQQQIPFDDGSALRLTISRYYTPTGRSIQKPYDKGNDAYFHELYDRQVNGEYIEMDSTMFSDSLRFYTPEGKVVYGGGGIMPDIFVPYDTTQLSSYLARVSNKGLVYRFAFNYADKHREKLSSLDNALAMETYLKKQNLLADFVLFAEERGVEKNTEDLEKSKLELETRLMASIARNILDNDGFYPIYAKIDYTLHKALDILSKPQQEQ